MSKNFPYGDGIIPCVLWSAVTGVCCVAKLFSADLYNRPGSSFVCQTAELVIATTLECLTSVYEISAGAMRGLGRSLTPALITFLGSCVLRLIWIATACKMVHEFWVSAYYLPDFVGCYRIDYELAYEIVKKRVLGRSLA